MSRWGRFRFESGPKKPPPEHGIRIKKAGTTWWGQRWIEALERVLRGDAGRLARGRTYARAGRTHDLVVDGGKVSAQVTGSRPTPYAVTIQLTELPAATWQAVIDGLAKKAYFSAELLAGRMPEAIDDAFADAGASLFPRQRADLVTHCSCPDSGDPCKHVAATHYVLGEALDRDPFLLFELRGMTKDRVLAALRAARGGESEAPTKKKRGKAELPPDDVAREVPTVTLGKLKASDYDRPREPLPALHFGFAEPGTHGAVLRQLGEPPTWRDDATPAELLAPLVRAAADTARRLAMAEPAAPDDDSQRDPGGPPAAPRKTPRSAPGKPRKPVQRRK